MQTIQSFLPNDHFFFFSKKRKEKKPHSHFSLQAQNDWANIACQLGVVQQSQKKISDEALGNIFDTSLVSKRYHVKYKIRVLDVLCVRIYSFFFLSMPEHLLSDAYMTEEIFYSLCRLQSEVFKLLNYCMLFSFGGLILTSLYFAHLWVTLRPRIYRCCERERERERESKKGR